jgi:hypothetical protein
MAEVMQILGENVEVFVNHNRNINIRNEG